MGKDLSQILVHQFPFYKNWHYTKFKPTEESYKYFGYNWLDLIYYNLLKDNGKIRLLEPRKQLHTALIVNMSNREVVIKNGRDDIIHLRGYETAPYDVTFSKYLYTSNGILFQQIFVGDELFVLVNIQDIIDGNAKISKTIFFTNFLAASGIVDSDVYYNSISLGQQLGYVDTKLKISDGEMFDFVGYLEQHWEKVNMTKKVTKKLKIPKKVHWVWLVKNHLGFTPAKKASVKDFAKFMKTWLIRNPDFEFNLWTNAQEMDIDKSVLDLIDEMDIDFKIRDFDEIDIMLKSCPKSKKLRDIIFKNKNVGIRADVLRQAALFVEGGIYADINDLECLIPMEEFLYKFEFICGVEPMIYINNAFLASAAGHFFPERFLKHIALIDNKVDLTADKNETNEDREERDNIVVETSGPIKITYLMYGFLKDFYEGNREYNMKEVVILPSKFLYTNYMISDENPTRWIAPCSMCAHFDTRLFL